MGSPTIVSDLVGRESWLYYSEDVKNFLFYFPKVTARTVFVIRFDKSDTVENLKKFDLASEQKKLKFASNYTSIKAHKIGFFKTFKAIGICGQISLISNTNGTLFFFDA